MVSAKFYSDYDESDVFAGNFAYEGEVSLERLKQLEISFLNAIGWNLLVSENEFYEKLKTVERLLALKEGLPRNSFTYTEMELLAPTLELAKLIVHYTTILMFTYACSILTIALSSILLTSIPMPLTSTADVSRTTTATGENATQTESTALLPSVIISRDADDAVFETECTFDELKLDDDDPVVERTCNFTIDFALFNNFEWENRRNYQDYAGVQLGLLPKFEPVPVVW
jgi:hypothetical protein